MNRETNHHHLARLGRWARLIVWLAVMVGGGLVGTAIAQRGTRLPTSAFRLQPAARTAPNPVQSLASGAATAALGPATNRTVKVSLAWDASPDHASITNYAIHFGSRSGVYTNSADAGTNLSGTISNLVSNTRYYFAVNATSRQGVTSPFCAEVFWPQPVTNYIGVGIKTNGRVIVQLVYTNPPGDVVLFQPFIWQTNDAVSVLRLNTGALIVGNTNQP